MLNVGKIEEGFVLDHIKAGTSLTVYHQLQLDKSKYTSAIIQYAKSKQMGSKDILKVECPIDHLNMDVLGYIDHTITVNVIQNGEIVAKRTLTLPEKITDIIKCNNPRCITSIEQELPHVFHLTDVAKEVYRCKYCEEKYNKTN
ncbi:MAG: aspartate carbamoyltransferase regulatory subunit [Eubacteriales bacterium]